MFVETGYEFHICDLNDVAVAVILASYGHRKTPFAPFGRYIGALTLTASLPINP